jgi:hypothetical protein
MKKLTLGIATAAVLMTAVPAMAQIGVQVGPVGVGIGAPGPYNGGCGYNRPCGGYYDQYNGGPIVVAPGPNVVVAPGPNEHARHNDDRR